MDELESSYELDWVFPHEHPRILERHLGAGVARGASVSAPVSYSRRLCRAGQPVAYSCGRGGLARAL